MLATAAARARRRIVDDTAGPVDAVTTAVQALLTFPSGTMPDFLAYEALGVRGMAAGQSYADPVTGKPVIKVTDASFPAPNTSATCGQYSSGAPCMSLPWGPGGTMRTLGLSSSAGAFLVDYDEATETFSGLRAAPWGAAELQFGFSYNPATPQIAYYFKLIGDEGRHLARFDTSAGVMADAPTSFFPKDLSALIDDEFARLTWLQFDQSDRIFAFRAKTDASDNCGFWDSATDTTHVYAFPPVLPEDTGLDEPHLCPDGETMLVGYNHTSAIVRTSDGAITFNPTSHGQVGHPSLLRGGNMLQHGGGPNGDVAVRYNTVTNIETILAISGRALSGAYVDAHRASQWKQTNDDVLDDRLLIVSEQSSLFSTRSWANVAGAKYQALFISGMGVTGGITHVFQKNGAGTSITQRLMQVADVASILAPGQFCYVGTTLTMRAFGDLDLTVGANADLIHYYGAAGLGPYGIGFYQARGDTPSRLLCHHYSTVWTSVYDEASFASIASPDGKYVAFQSTMNLEGGRHDGFLVRLY